MSRRPRVVASLLALALLMSVPATTAIRAQAPLPGLAHYRGLATWVDMFDRGPWRYPVRAVRTMRSKGVRTLFVQTSNYRMGFAIYKPAQLSKMIDEAHRQGMGVIGWYLPGYDDVPRDMRRIRRAINFETEAGNRFHGFALDIEATAVRDISTRNRRAITVSRRTREFVGPAYTLGAIVPEANARYWPNFPYKGIAPYHDVYLPMAYFTYRVSGGPAVYRFTVDNIRAIRAALGRRTPVHIIGGIGGRTTAAEMRSFVRAVSDRNATGASLYDFPITTNREWRILQDVR